MIYDHPVDTAEIALLLKPYARLDEWQLRNTLTYIDVLVKWNTRMNLTSVRNPREMVQRHFGESFFVARQLLPADARVSVIDVGSGAGFPGIPLALRTREARVTLIESNARKATFLKEVIRELQVGNVEVFHGRAEDYSANAELVTMRAVEKFGQVLPLAASLASDGGRLAVMIGSGQVGQAKKAVTDLAWQEPILIPGGHSRVLLVGTRRVRVEG